MRPARLLLSLLLLPACVTCVDPSASETPGAQPLPWLLVDTLELSAAGESAAVHIDFPAEQRVVAVRVRPLDAGPAAEAGLCYVLETADGVEVTAPQPGAAIHLVTDEAALAAGGSLALTLSLRDCATGLRVSRGWFADSPTAVEVEAAWLPAVASDAALVLEVNALVSADAGLVDDAHLDALIAAAAEPFAAIGVALRVTQVATIPARGTVRVTPGQPEALFDLQAQAFDAFGPTERAVAVAFVRCIDVRTLGHRSTPAGFTPRIPGLAVDATRPPIVLLGTGGCVDDGAPRRAALDGAILAHELGHHLGLHHQDSAAGLAHDPAHRLMHSAFERVAGPEARGFSAAEQAVLRRHPGLVAE